METGSGLSQKINIPTDEGGVEGLACIECAENALVRPSSLDLSILVGRDHHMLKIQVGFLVIINRQTYVHREQTGQKDNRSKVRVI